jgi:Methyltransferase domain
VEKNLNFKPRKIMDIIDQIQAGKLRCVRTGMTLSLGGGGEILVTGDGQSRYSMARGTVPVVLKNENNIRELLERNEEMETEYNAPNFYQRLRNFLYKDYNSRDFMAVFDKTIKNRSVSDVIISVGGGPMRGGPHVTNLNIGPFPNVDIVGDAHDLPYHDGVVDTVYCTAVLEHVREPITAVQEMHRVLKLRGQVLSIIPFMQAYHGYPNHFQNYTLSGHEYLYSSHGFRVIASGACLGPVVAMTVLNARFFLEYLPWGLNFIVGRGVQFVGLLLRPLDRLLETNSKRHILASATYVLAEKI